MRHLVDSESIKKQGFFTKITDTQSSNLKKRVVKLIKDYPTPREIFEVITAKELPYAPPNTHVFPIRDRAILALYFASAGRGAEVCGGRRYARGIEEIKDDNGVFHCVVCNKALAGNQRKFCCKAHRYHDAEQAKKDGYPTIVKSFVVKGADHYGILVENIKIDDKKILISNMEVVKRSQRIIDKYGIGVTMRPSYAIPLKLGFMKNEFWNQLVPFGWLIKEYLLCGNAPKEGKLFNVNNKTASKWIATPLTGNYLNWFRAQGKHFYGYFLLPDTIKLSKFVNDQDPRSEKDYIGYDWTEGVADKTEAMDFDWIKPAIEKIRRRMENNGIKL